MRQGRTFAALVSCVCLVLAIGSTPAPALAAGWSLPDESIGTRVAPLLLLSRPEVRDDLRLSSDQSVEVEKAIADLHAKAVALRGLTGEEAIARRRLVDEGQRTWLEAHLTPDQVERLAQLDLGWEGPAAMVTRKPVAEALALSDEQKAALARTIHECNGRREKGMPAAESELEHAQRALAILSEGQKARWERMVGRPIAIKATATATSATGPAPGR